jgi:hypothetical protein
MQDVYREGKIHKTKNTTANPLSAKSIKALKEIPSSEKLTN